MIQIKNQRCIYDTINQKIKNKYKQKYQSMKYISSRILQSNTPLQQLSILNTIKTNTIIKQNPQLLSNNEDNHRHIVVQKIKSLLQPVFPIKSKSKSYSLTKSYHKDYKQQKQYEIKQSKKKYIESQRCTSQRNCYFDTTHNRYINQNLIKSFIQDKISSQRPFYVNHNKIYSSHQKTRGQLKTLLDKQRVKLQTSNNKSQSNHKIKQNQSFSQKQRHKTVYSNIQLLNSQVNKIQVLNYQDLLNKQQKNIQDHQKYIEEQKQQKNYTKKSKSCLGITQQNKKKVKNLQSQILQQVDKLTIQLKKKDGYKQKTKQKSKLILREKQKQQWKQCSIIRKNCLFMSSYMLIKSRMAISDEEDRISGKELGNTIQDKSNRPHIGGSNGIKKFNPTKQHYYKLRQQNMKRRNIINHYSKSNKSEKRSNSNINFNNGQHNYSNSIIRGRQFYLYEKPAFSIEPW